MRNSAGDRSPYERKTELDSTLEDLQLAARVEVPVLITGGQYADRFRCARLIHQTSRRRTAAFVTATPLNIERVCTLKIPATAGSTLFVDDVTELSPRVQAVLLSFLTGRTDAASGRRESLGMRLISGASRHLGRECASGAFSAALFYRLNVIHLVLST